LIKNDRWIKEMAENHNMIEPFVGELVRKVDRVQQYSDVISYGLSSFGYDIRLSPNDFKLFRHIPGTVINPKDFNPNNLEPAELHLDEYGEYFIIPAHSYGLGVAVEKLDIPDNITVICIGKSTMARCGIIANLTPAEAGWKGYLTLEFSNSSSADCRIYANEGVVQLLFLEGEKCDTSYQDRDGKYQNQTKEITLARV
jgi:dCTP deaminase